MNIVQRPRRLRGNETIRGMVRETRISKSALIYPAFVAEGLTEPREIEAMPGQYRHTTESLLHMGERLLEAGINKMMLFGIPLAPPGRRWRSRRSRPPQSASCARCADRQRWSPG